MKTLEIMKTHVVHTTPDSTLAQAVDLMDLYQVRALPVIAADGRICGMIAETDVLRAFRDRMDQGIIEVPEEGSEQGSLTLSAVGAAVRSLPVADFMIVPAPTVTEDQEVDEIVPLLFAATASVYVLDRDGRVVGTVSRIELYQAAFEG